MKKHFRKILSGVTALAMLVSGIVVNAAAGSMEVEWYGDYSNSSNPKLVVEIESPALYKQQVTVVVYPSTVTNPTPLDYIRVKEVTVNGSEKAPVTFNVTENAFDASDNHYKLKVQGGGYMSDISTATKDVYVLTSSVASNLLTQINGASNIPSVLRTGATQNADKALNITEDTTRDNAIALILNGMKGGGFGNLDEVKEAWAAAEIIDALRNETAQNVKIKLEANAEAIGIDITDKDYTDNSLELAQYLIANEDGVSTVSGLKKLYGQCIGIVLMNNSTSGDAPSNLDKYISNFDIDSTILTKYNTKLSEIQRAQVAGAMYQKNIQTPSEFVSKFETAVTTLPDTPTSTPSPTTGPGVGGGGGGGAGGGGAGISGPGAGSQVTPTPTVAPTAPPDSNASASGFRDMTKSHWADHYVAELSQKGIINGYDDNTFRPNNNVTREEFVKMIITATGLYDENAECEFDDVPNSAWSYKYIASAYKNDIVSGVTDTTFGVGIYITRQDVAVIAARILTRLGKTATVGDTTLTDIDTVTDYAQDSVKLLNSMGIINGFDDGSFMPHNALTRAEAAAIISKLIANL